MAAVTINSQNYAIVGSKRLYTANVSTANTGDTLVTGLKVCEGVSADPPSTTGLGLSESAGTITFNYTGGGGMSNIRVIATGPA